MQRIISTGSRLFSAGQLQWAPTLDGHNPDPPIKIGGSVGAEGHVGAIFRSRSRIYAANERTGELPISDALQGRIRVSLSRESWPLTPNDVVVDLTIDIITASGIIQNFIGAQFVGGEVIGEDGPITSCWVGSTHSLPNFPDRRVIVDIKKNANFRSALLVEVI